MNGEPITAAQYRAALDFDDREAEGLSPRTPEALETARRQLLDALVDRKLLGQAARRRGLSVSDEEVERAFLRLRADWPGDSFDRLLAETQLGTAQLKDQIREKLLVERLFAEEVFARIALTDPDVAAWIEANGKSLDRPEQVRAAQIVVKTDEEARRLQDELKKGAAFDELARRFSLSPDARAGGDLGWFGRGDMPPQFEEVCFGLAVNRVSDVVASPYGYHLFKVLEKRGAQKASGELLHATAEQALRREREAAAQDEYLASLRKAAKIEIDEAAIQRLKGTR